MRTLFMALNFAAKVVKNIEIRKDLNKNLYKPVIFFSLEFIQAWAVACIKNENGRGWRM